MRLIYWAYVFTMLIAAMLLGVVIRSGSALKENSDTPRSFGYDLQKEFEFTYPGSMIEAWQWSEESLIILDQHAQVWFRLDQNGTVLDTLGTAGVAPYENQQVKNFYFQKDMLASVDVGARVIKRENDSQGSRQFRKIQESIWDGIPLQNDSFLLLNDASEEFGFFTLTLGDSKTGELLEMSKALNTPVGPNANIAYEGFFVRGDSMQYYVCSRTGRVIAFDNHGGLMKSFETLDATPPPEVRERRAANLVIFEREPDEIVNYAGTTFLNELYILSQVAFMPTVNPRVDIYDVKGRYKASVIVPRHKDNLPMNILHSGEYLFVFYEDLTIIGYGIQPREDSAE